MSDLQARIEELNRDLHEQKTDNDNMRWAIREVLKAAEFKDQPSNTAHIPRFLIEKLRDVSRE